MMLLPTALCCHDKLLTVVVGKGCLGHTDAADAVAVAVDAAAPAGIGQARQYYGSGSIELDRTAVGGLNISRTHFHYAPHCDVVHMVDFCICTHYMDCEPSYFAFGFHPVPLSSQRGKFHLEALG